MKRRQYPRCVECEVELNPNFYDDCEKYYLTDDGPLCKYCFIEREKDWLDQNPDEYAELMGVPVIRNE